MFNYGNVNFFTTEDINVQGQCTVPQEGDEIYRLTNVEIFTNPTKMIDYLNKLYERPILTVISVKT